MAYLRAPVETDLDTLIEQALDRLADKFPGWVPREGHLEVAELEEKARMASETAQVAAVVPDHIYSAHGRVMHGIPQGLGARAVGVARFTVRDDAGYNIPAGTVVAWQVTGSESLYFETVSTLTIMPGDLEGTVAIVAEADGEDGNGHGPGQAVLEDQLAFVDTVEFDEETDGGRDPETDEAYRDRLADELQLMAPRPIKPADFAVLARRTDGVTRALALDNYDPADDSWDNPRMVTLVPVDGDGQPPAAEVVDDLVADMEARREVNFVVNTTTPDYTPVEIEFEIVVDSGEEHQTILDRAVAAVEGWITPAHWGGGADSPPVWELRDTVPYNEAIGVLYGVDGVAAVLTLTINGDPADLELTGVAPLPAALDASGSSVTGTVVT